MIKGEDGAWNNYINDRIDIGLFFFFVACAGISIIVWVFNWICWLNQCCCCDFLHNPVNKKIAWWLSFIFLLGMLACCIAAVVSINRFGFALDGILCALDRIYYDFKYGQIKEQEPKWKGFEIIQGLVKNLDNFRIAISSSSIILEKGKRDGDGNEYITFGNDGNNKEYKLRYKKIYESWCYLNSLKEETPNLLEKEITSLYKYFFLRIHKIQMTLKF